MAWISFGLLLIFSDQPSSAAAAAAARSGCISEDKLNNRTDKFRRKHWDNVAISKNPVLEPDALDCAQFAKQTHRGEMNKRSLSPWTYSLDQDLDRIPHEIVVAKCLCRGCIINHREDNDYNSVPVYALVKVLKKIQCSGEPKKYAVKHYYMKVAVACVCVVPKYHK
ncbi:interleukin-17C-like [Micropterus salmoides]|uniref:interleukin-17C-like n=1 Tax=Micropterus salmoides TaxID=27706 RepID=UPI0018EC2CE1|nr:interleukin-17C-like [Micropterus salmoides]